MKNTTVAAFVSPAPLAGCAFTQRALYATKNGKCHFLPQKRCTSRKKWNGSVRMVTISPVPTETLKDPHFGKLNRQEKIYTAESEGVVDSPIDEVWNLFKRFGKWNEWWDGFYSRMELEGEERVGTVRSYETSRGSLAKEELLELDEKEYRISYSQEEGSPDVFAGAVTTIDLEKTVDGKTRVVWNVAFQPKLALLASRIKDTLEKTYTMAIQSMENHFHPSIGTATLTFTSGKITEGDADYMLISIGPGATESVNLSRKGAIRGPSEVEFSVNSIEDSVMIQVMDSRIIRQDQQIGSASVELKDLIGETETSFVVVNKEGSKVGELFATVELSEGVVPAPPSPEEMMGKVLMAIGKDFIEKLTEISCAAAKDEADNDPNTPWEYGSYPAILGLLPKYCKYLPVTEAISPKRMGQLYERKLEFLYSQLPLLQVAKDASKLSELTTDNDPFQVFFRNWVQAPKGVIKNWMKDEELTAQQLRGLNPRKITLARRRTEIPKEFYETEDQKRKIDELIEEGSLFYCDYSELMVGDYEKEKGVYTHQARWDMLKTNRGPRKYWYAPVMVCYKKEDGKLGILGIQLTRHKDKRNEIYSPKTHPPRLWQFAKHHFTTADNMDHQWSTHLGLTHLTVEPFIVACHNAFPPNPPESRHVVGTLLDPHFDDTLMMNFIGRQSIVSDVVPITDATFSTGTVNGMKSFSKSYESWDFLGDNFVNNLKKRGFDEDRSDGLEGYYYREDGFKIWNLFMKHFKAVLSSAYSDDAAVANDRTLQGWCDEIRDPNKANVASFPAKIESVDQLVEIVTTLVFYCTAQHSAVNFTQLRYASYFPNRPPALLAPMPKTPAGGKDIGPDVIEGALPNFATAEFQTMFAYFLTAPPDNPMSGYNVLKKRFPTEVQEFVNDLTALQNELEERNRQLESKGEIPYEYMEPRTLPMSINI